MDVYGGTEERGPVTNTLAIATRLLRGVATVATVAFVWTAASFLVPQRRVTTVGVAASFAAAVALALSSLLTLLVLTWRAKELPGTLRQPVTSQSVLLLLIGAILFWADAGRPTSMIAASVMLVFGVVGLVRARGKAHQWVEAGVGAPNFARATRVGVLAIVLALSNSIIVKFQGFSSERLEISQVRVVLLSIEEAQRTFYADSGRYASSLEQLTFEKDSAVEEMEMTAAANGFSARAKGWKFGGACTLDATVAPEGGADLSGILDCELGPRTQKAILPDLPLYLLGAVLCTWLVARPLTPLPKPSS